MDEKNTIDQVFNNRDLIWISDIRRDTTLSDASDYDQTVHAVRLQITEEHPPKRQQQAAAAKAPEITPFTS